MTSEAEWIKARKARQLLIAAGIHHAEFQLRQALRIGQVHGRALHAEIKLRGRHGGKKEFRNWEVPDEVWKGGPDNSAFSLDGDFYSSGDYEIRIGAVKLTGLSFNKAELIDHFDIVEPIAEAANMTEKSKGGRAPKSLEWNNALAAVIAYAQCKGGVEHDQQPGAFLNAALDFASELGLDGPTISIDRCSDGIRLAKRLVGRSEGWPNWENA